MMTKIILQLDEYDVTNVLLKLLKHGDCFVSVTYQKKLAAEIEKQISSQTNGQFFQCAACLEIPETDKIR